MNIKNNFIKFLLLIILANLGTKLLFAQVTTIDVDSIAPDTLSKFARMNKKAEALFKVMPFPIVSYSTETGTVLGLVKYNMVRLVKKDTVSAASSFSELVSASTEGHYKVIIGSNLYFKENKFIFKTSVQYMVFPEYLLGIGNVVSRENLERVKTNRFIFDNQFLLSITPSENFYLGVFQEYQNYYNIERDSLSYIESIEYPGYDGGVVSGIGLGLVYDTRDHKYNSKTGVFIDSNIKWFGDFLASDFTYYSFELDIRKFFNPWFEHVIALQLYTEGNFGTVPFYSLGMIGGTNRMRAYYLGIIRDKVVADAQIEYRMPVWSFFGITAFASTGRVAEKYSGMDFSGLWYAGGLGLRFMIDRTNKANLRVDFGYGQQGAKSVIIGFSEAF